MLISCLLDHDAVCVPYAPSLRSDLPSFPKKLQIAPIRHQYAGKNLLRSLLAEDIPCTYILLSALGAVLPTVDLTLLGTHSLLSNGAMYSRAGTAVVAMMSKSAGIPVICCCETYKFSDRIMLDSVVGNELGGFLHKEIT